MTYLVRTTENFEKQLAKLDKFTAKTILKWLAKNVDSSTDLPLKGKALSGNHAGKWRYRIGDYRVICKINDKELIVLALEAGHRKKVYN